MTLHLQKRLADWKFPPHTFVSQLIRTERMAREVARTLGDVVPEPPRKFDLSDIADEIREHWYEQKTLNGLPRRTLRLLPWVIFYPPDQPEDWLGASHSFQNETHRWLREDGRAATIAALVSVILRQYPEQLDTFVGWRSITRMTLAGTQSVRLNSWRARAAEYRLLDADGPEVCARTWLSSKETVDDFLERIGLDQIGTDARFLHKVCEELLSTISRRLRDRSISTPDLKHGLALLRSHGGRLRFDDLTIPTSKAILRPFEGDTPPEELKAVIQRFLLQVVGDPRIKRGAWQGIPDSVRRIMLRWLVEDTLEQFFRLLDATALDRHWRQRKAFWKAYLDKDVISDAWLVLGSHARRKGREILGEAGGTWAKLGKGGDRSQSVLLMRLSGLTIAEWSHNGRCRIWLSGSAGAPDFYEPRYRRSALRSKSADYSVIHDHYGNWRGKIERFILRQTGIARE